MSTEDLIESLTKEAKPVKTLLSPMKSFAWAILMLVLYVALMIGIGDIRQDMAIQLERPLLVAEFVLMLFVMLTGLYAAVCLRYPDEHQTYKLSNLSLYGLAGFVILMMVQWFMPNDPAMFAGAHVQDNKFLCTIEIAAISALPALGLMVMLGRGATVSLKKAGFFVTLTSTLAGAIIIRLWEQNDTIAHLLVWHYTPMLIFAAIGAFVGAKILKW